MGIIYANRELCIKRVRDREGMVERERESEGWREVG